MFTKYLHLCTKTSPAPNAVANATMQSIWHWNDKSKVNPNHNITKHKRNRTTASISTKQCCSWQAWLARC